MFEWTYTKILFEILIFLLLNNTQLCELDSGNLVVENIGNSDNGGVGSDYKHPKKFHCEK